MRDQLASLWSRSAGPEKCKKSYGRQNKRDLVNLNMPLTESVPAMGQRQHVPSEIEVVAHGCLFARKGFLHRFENMRRCFFMPLLGMAASVGKEHVDHLLVGHRAGKTDA